MPDEITTPELPVTTDETEAPAEVTTETTEVTEPTETPVEATEASEGADPTDAPLSATLGELTEAPALEGEPTETPAETPDAAPAELETPDAAPVVPEEDAVLPLDSSAVTDASPVPEAIDAPADATAPAAPSETEAPAAEEPKAEQGEGESEEPKAEAKPEGEPGLGATFDGTDTPEFMLSQPVDPVTCRPLDGSGELMRVGTSAVRGGVSDSGQVQPGQLADEGSEDASGFEDMGSDDEEQGAEDGDCSVSLREKITQAQSLLAEILGELDGI